MVDVPIAILTYFVYPLLTGLASALTGLDRLTGRGVAAALAAFLGLGLMIGAHPAALPAVVNALLLDLNRLYSEMGQKATTDFDQYRSHSNEILNLMEIDGKLAFYQQDKDWFYRNEERRWITMNDQSSWRKIERHSCLPYSLPTPNVGSSWWPQDSIFGVVLPSRTSITLTMTTVPIAA